MFSFASSRMRGTYALFDVQTMQMSVRQKNTHQMKMLSKMNDRPNMIFMDTRTR